MESLDPVLKITVAIEQLRRDLDRQQANYDRAMMGGWIQRARNKAAIKRNFKFYRYYIRESIKYLKDYRDLQLRIHNKKVKIMKELEDDNISELEQSCTAST